MDPIVLDSSPSGGAMSAVRRAFGKVTVEPGVFVSTFAFGMWIIIAQNLLIDKVCRVNFGLDPELCANLEEHKKEQIEVQKMVSILAMFSLLITSLPGVIICLLVGPWSDSHGRKPLLVLPMLGYCTTQIYLLGLAYFSNARAEWFLISGLFGGGFTTFLTGIFTYIADITRLDNRTSRIAFVDFCLFLGFPTGTLASARVFKYFYGFYGVFGLSLALYVANSLFFLIFIKETRGPKAQEQYRALTEEIPPEIRERGFFNWKNVVDVFKTSFRRREGNIRLAIVTLMFLMMINFSCFSTSNLMYLYTRLKFNWTEQEYTIWFSIGTLATTLGSITFVPLMSSKLKVHDALIGIVGAISGIAANMTLAFVNEPWMLYLGSAVGMLNACSAIIIRSMLSKLGPKSELGKIYALVSCLESTVPIISVPILTVIYNSTIDFFPGAIFLCQAGIFIFIGSMLTFLYFVLTRPGVNYGVLVDDPTGSPEHVVGSGDNSEASSSDEERPDLEEDEPFVEAEA